MVTILILIAVICWFLAAIGVPVAWVNLTALGLCFFGAGLIVDRRAGGPR